jgi:hypothetical protein
MTSHNEKSEKTKTTIENQNQHMKTISLLTAMFLIALSASPAVASEQVPSTAPSQQSKLTKFKARPCS